MGSIQQDLAAFGKKIVSAGLVAGAGGNISARDGSTVWMKPSGFAMDEMEADDLCGIELASGKQIAGRSKPTSEVNMHLAAYRARPDILAVFHTHSPWASGVISSGIEMKPMFPEYVNDLGRRGTIPYILPTTKELAKAVGRVAKTCDTLFLVNHGVVALGTTMKQAYYRCLVVEDAAKSLVAASIVGKPIFLTEEQAAEILALETVQHRIRMMGDR